MTTPQAKRKPTLFPNGSTGFGIMTGANDIINPHLDQNPGSYLSPKPTKSMPRASLVQPKQFFDLTPKPSKPFDELQASLSKHSYGDPNFYKSSSSSSMMPASPSQNRFSSSRGLTKGNLNNPIASNQPKSFKTNGFNQQLGNSEISRLQQRQQLLSTSTNALAQANSSSRPYKRGLGIGAPKYDVILGAPRGEMGSGSHYSMDPVHNFIGVYRVYKDVNGQVDSKRQPEFVYNLAIEKKTNIDNNIRAAQDYQRGLLPLIQPPLGIVKSLDAYHYPQLLATYVGSHVGQNSPGDFKRGLNPTQDPTLWQATDDAGNFNAGAVEAALELSPELVGLSGEYAHVKDHGVFKFGSDYFDQDRGQEILQDGYKYYQRKYRKSK